MLSLAVPSSVHAANNPQASIDRNVVSEGDSITLTIRVNATGSFDAPDYSVLERDFQVFGSSESTQHSFSNGNWESSTVWQTTLLPKHSGSLVIPALTVGGGQTQPLTIRVNSASQTNSEDSDEPVFIETQLDHKSVYVQQQLLLTVRIFHAIQLDDMHLSEPTFDNASIRKVAETTFRRDIKGSTYLVHELTYAIFPQQPGELTIPELVFSAVQPTTRRSLFDFPGQGQGRGLRKMSRQISVPIKSIPKSFSGSVWLPAKNLTLVESWSNSAKQIAVGESITRKINIRADGLLAAQLPALDPPQLDNAKLYNDQPTLDDQQDANGVHSKRIENMALIPSKTGDLQIPEMRVVWWDVDSDSEKQATLPPSTLRIAGGATSTSNATNVPTPQPRNTTNSSANTVTIAPAAISEPANATPPLANRWWQTSTAVLALAWSITLYLYWRLRQRVRHNAPQTAETTSAANTVAHNEDAAFRNLKDSCRANNPAAARHALLSWAQQFYRDANIHTTEQLLRIGNNDLLTREVQQLDNRLFGTQLESNTWNGENLLSVVRELRNKRTGKLTVEQSLPPLYPLT